jgi:hypothetical protein
LAKGEALNTSSTFGNEGFPELSPASCSTNINQGLKTRPSQVQDILRRRRLDLTQESNCRNSWKLANKLRNLCSLRAATAG